MIFGKLVRAVFGAEELMPRARGSVRPEDVINVPFPALRDLFHSRYYAGPPADRDEERRQREKAIGAALGMNETEVISQLLLRAPLLEILKGSVDGQGRFHLAQVFDAALMAGWQRAFGDPRGAAQFSERQLADCLRGLQLTLLQSGATRHGSAGQWVRPLIAQAGRIQKAGMRQALIDFLDGLVGKATFARNNAVALALELLPAAGLDARDVPALRKTQGEIARRDAIRERILDDCPPLLREAVAAVLDGDVAIASHRMASAAKHPALEAIKTSKPTDRGAMLVALLDILERQKEYGIERWGQMVRRHGSYTLDTATSTLNAFGHILGTLVGRGVIVTDLDREAARFVAHVAQHHYIDIGGKPILAWLFEAGRGAPNGRLVAALRKELATRQSLFINDKIRGAIEDFLRDLPAAPSVTRSSSALGPGFGRKGMVASSPGETAALPGLQPIVLPRFELGQWDARATIGRHFDNFLDVRLYDRTHREWLEQMARIHQAVVASGQTEPAQVRKTIASAARAQGIKLTMGSDRWHPGEAIALAASLHTRSELLAPFVLANAESARAISKQAAGIASKATPPAKWLTELRAAAAAIDPAELRTFFDQLVAAPIVGFNWQVGLTDVYHRALIYLVADEDPSWLGPRLAEFALKRCYVTEAGVGIRAEKLGNACLWALVRMKEGAGVPYLARILARTKYPKVRSKIDAALNEAAAATGLTRGALDELSVPTHDLEAGGRRTVFLGGGSAELRVVGARDVAIAWTSEDGKPLKSPSVAMKADKIALKAVKEAAKEIEADLGTQVVRLQSLYLEDRHWTVEEWRERYFDHPLVGTLARKLVWWIEREDQAPTAALFDGQAMARRDGQAIELSGANIRLWHPIDDRVEEVLGWRDRLEELQLTQPFAQVWREVYALTDAERTTRTYSNRWAAHLLKQHQAMTLARMNGWKVTHRMWVDAANDQPWHLPLPAHGMVADYWVEGAGGDDPQVTDSQAYFYVTTDRIQFHRLEEGAAGPFRGEAVALETLPSIIFSEVMRHADLFTAVASIAADPNWLDRGRDAAHPSQWGAQADAYWHQINSAELLEAGKRRREMLERIIPRLKIAGQLSLDDRHLVVAGKRHTYQIHLTSGACSRSGRHICIVPAAADGPRLWLPFEGDRTLSIILSKAMLLAADDNITDPVILRQL